jgi:hypothetical protein
MPDFTVLLDPQFLFGLTVLDAVLVSSHVGNEEQFLTQKGLKGEETRDEFIFVGFELHVDGLLRLLTLWHGDGSEGERRQVRWHDILDWKARRTLGIVWGWGWEGSLHGSDAVVSR